MRNRWLLLGAALLGLAAVGAGSLVLRPHRELGPNVEVPPEVWVAVDPATGLADADVAPRVLWPAGQDLPTQGFALSWSAPRLLGPALLARWDADAVDRLRTWAGLGDGIGIAGVHVDFEPCAERRTDADGAWRRYASTGTEIASNSTRRVVDLSRYVGSAPPRTFTVRSSGGIRVSR